MRNHTRAFTLVDLCIVLVAALLVALVTFPVLAYRAREQAQRVRCASNLRQIGQAMQMYGNGETRNGQSFARTKWDEQGDDPAPTQYTGVQSPNPFADNGPANNDVTAALFLLLRTQELSPAVFVCDSDLSAQPLAPAGGVITSQSNFPSRACLSYSMQNPYPSKAARDAGFHWDINLSADFAVASDMNPGTQAVVQVTPSSSRAQVMAANSLNHQGDGQNVLYGDGHVEFQQSPLCGPLRGPKASAVEDNIFAFGTGTGKAGLKGAPQDAIDNVLLPLRVDGFQPPTPVLSLMERDPETGMLIVIGCALLAAGAIAAVWIFVSRRRRGGQSL